LTLIKNNIISLKINSIFERPMGFYGDFYRVNIIKNQYYI